MNVGKLAVVCVGLAVSAFGAGCATREVVVERAPAPQPAAQPQVQVVEQAPPPEVVVQTAPPPEQVEVVPAAPSAEHVWIRGHWHWGGAGWTWVPGHYEMRRVGYRWIPAHYATRGGVYVYVPGHWGR